MMEITLEHIAEEVWTLKGAYNGISREIIDLKDEVRDLRKDTHNSIQELYKKTERDKTELMSKIAETKTELIERMDRDKIELISKIADTETKLYGKIAETKAEIIKWMFIFWIGQVAVVAGLLAYFFKFHQ